jgi:hypothetical protein
MQSFLCRLDPAGAIGYKAMILARKDADNIF